MEQTLRTKDESKNDGETSRGHDQTVVPTDAEWTSPESDWVRNRCNIPMELRSSLDDMGYPIEKNEENPTKVTFAKVPLRLRKLKGSKDYFDPTVISFGPYHHGKRELQEIDTIKDEAMLKFIKESGKSFPEFYYKVRNMNNDTRACYVDCSKEKYCDDMLALIMLRDGCFISYLLDVFVHKKRGKVLELFDNHGNFLVFSSVIKDMVLLENQIPLAILELLMSLRYNNNEKVVPKMIKQFIYYVFWRISLEEVPEDMTEEPQANCLLECIQKEFSKVVDRKKERTLCFNFVPLYRFCLWNPFANTSEKEPDLIDDSPSYRSLSELKAKGIHFKSIHYGPHSLKKRKSFSFKDVEFIPGLFRAQLKLPPLFFTHSTEILWHNLIAFELMSPECDTEIVFTSYINFLNALIANPDDVKELRSKHILLNRVGSDEELFKKFKEIATVRIQDGSIYRNVRNDIEKYCRSKIRTWVAEIIYKYFRNPWSALGLFAAIAVVVLTFVQTYFTIYPWKR